MHGLITVGTAEGVAEIEVAAAVSAAARAAGSYPVAFVAAATGPSAGRALDVFAEAAGAARPALSQRVFAASAPPLVAARHEGTTLDPRVIVESALAAGDGDDPLVVATAGGLMAPLAERYTNRDLAAELGLPVVVAAAAGPGLLNGALLTIESARGAGVAVSAVVIAGWPDAPARALLDERALLEGRAGVPVVTLAADAVRDNESLAVAARGWPVGDWARASSAPAPAAEGAPPQRVTLDPYVAWDPHAVGDPRTTPRTSIMAALLEIVGVEGPMTASRAFAVYNRASGGRKLTNVARAPLSSALYWLAQERKVALVPRAEIPWQDDDVVRMPDSPGVRVRELGPRGLEEVPLDEIAELVRRLRAARGVVDATGTKRAVLNAYGLVRLTTKADEYLGLALDLAEGE